ncbi:unknown [Clostridium sp. CAG:448]|nr:unknown [Clostridium sp. CAG:448]
MQSRNGELFIRCTRRNPTDTGQIGQENLFPIFHHHFSRFGGNSDPLTVSGDSVDSGQKGKERGFSAIRKSCQNDFFHFVVLPCLIFFTMYMQSAFAEE